MRGAGTGGRTVRAPWAPGVDRLAQGSAAVRLKWEIGVVLAVSLGSSAVYAIVDVVARLTERTPLKDQSAAVNPSQATRQWLDFTYQFLGLAFQLAPVALVLLLLTTSALRGWRRIGLDARRPGRDALGALGLLAVIGIPGIAFYALGRALGITVQVAASPLDTHWWTVPILLFSAVRAGLQEEVIVVGYLFTRLSQLGVGRWPTIVAAALLRGSYHLYQGVGPFLGNAVMGVVFGWCYARWGRVTPLVLAHTAIDVLSFVGYPLAVAWWPGLFGPPKG